MANATRMQIAQSATIYHRMTASNDAAVHDTATSEALASGLGSSADFELDSDDDITYVDNSQLVTTIDELDAGAGASTACTAFIWIKNSGFSDAAKETAIAASVYLKIHFQEAANEYISLFPGESIMFHNPGTDLDAVNDYWATTSTGTIYAEVICGAK
tara:strand:- start:43 stop:519 length:477 start_codon:yes stop_codon:yes gene_type:complete